MALSLGAKSAILDSTTQCVDYSVKFDLNLNGVQDTTKHSFSNVLGFQSDVRYASAGFRTPQLLVRNQAGSEATALLGVYTYMGSYSNFKAKDFVITKNEWHSIEIKQHKRLFSVHIDGVEQYRKMNYRARKFDNVSGFTCMEDKYDCGVGEYKNLEIDFDSCIKPTTPATTKTTTPITTKTTTPTTTTPTTTKTTTPAAPKMSVTCMKNDLVHMTASVPVDEVQMDLTKMQWALDTVNKVYTKSWTAADFDQQSEMSVDKNDNLVLTKRVKADCKTTKVDKVTVCVETGHTLDFQCKYPLGTRTVKNNFDVSGHDADVDAEGVGELKYTLNVADNNVDIGNKVAVTVTPLNKNLVYAQLNDCNVTYKGQSVSILDFDNATLQPVCAIGAHVGTGHGNSDLTFDWQAFKWATADKNAGKESQTISCTIALSKNAPVTQYGKC